MRCKIPNRDLAARLHKTIIRYNDHPYYVQISDNQIGLCEITNYNRVTKFVSPDDPLLDVSTPPLGYFNIFEQGMALYAIREPHRIYKQGICTSSVRINNILKQKVESTYLLTPGYKEAVLDHFPTLGVAFERLRSKQAASVAISREIALAITDEGIIQVFYRQDNVGWIPKGSNTVNVPSDEMGWVVSVHLEGFNWIIN